MPITLTINGETAEQLLAELRALAGGLKHEWKVGENVRMAAEIVDNKDIAGQTFRYDMREMDFTEVERVVTAHNPAFAAGFTPAPDIVEDKPKRKRRTKEEMEAERAAGLPPQEGDPELEPVAEAVDDILDDDPPASSATATRDDVMTYMSKVIQQRLLTPKEIREVFTTRAGGATNAASMDDRFAADVLAGLTEAAEKKSA